MSKDQNQNYWDQAEAGAREESGGGVVGKAKIVLGYFVYVSGITGNDRVKCLFVPDTPDKAGRQAAKIKAHAFAEKNGVEKRSAPWAAVTRLYENECASNGESVTWDADRFEVTPLWTLHQDGPSASKLVMDAIKEHGVPAGKDFYGRFGWLPDPFKTAQGESGMTAEDQSGNPKYPTVCTVLERYANKAAALEAIAGMSSDESASDSSKYGDEFPGEGWEDTDWEKEANEIEAALIAGVDDLGAFAADEYGTDATWVIRAMATGGMSGKSIAELTGMKKGKVRKLLASS